MDREYERNKQRAVAMGYPKSVAAIERLAHLIASLGLSKKQAEAVGHGIDELVQVVMDESRKPPLLHTAIASLLSSIFEPPRGL